jgi:tetratricopeptide (TPR) repeat protein
MRWLIPLAICPGLAFAEGCPTVPDHSAELAPLLETIRTAPDPVTAQVLMGRLWEIWTLAPDDHSQALLDAGRERIAAADFAGARAPLDELIEWCPGYAEGWNQRAFAWFLSQQYGEALDDLETALALSPDHIAAKAGLALTLMNLGRVEAGQSVLRDALEMNPWLPERGMLIEPPGETL